MSTDNTGKVDLLKKQRSAFKGQLTYFKNQTVVATTLGTFESLLRRIQVVYEKYDSVQSKVETLDENAFCDRDSFEDDYGKLESVLLNKIHELKKADETQATVSFQNSLLHEATSDPTSSMGMRLPELKLPSFSGLQTEWLSFRGVFSDLIHRRNIDPTVKFMYLISHIRTGSAYSLIESLPVTGENYETAWKVLCDRYNNEVAIQKIHMKELYDVKGPQENSSKSLQLFIDHLVKHYNSLKSLKVKVDEWDLLLIHHLMQKLDTASRADVIKASTATKILSFDKFIQTLRTRVELLQALQLNSSHQPSRYHRDIRNSSSHTNRAQALVSNANNCSYCSGPHTIVYCPSFNDGKLSPQMRFRFIRDHQLCTNCLVARHQVRDCTKPPCTVCGLKHNDRLHFKNYTRSNTVTSSTKLAVEANASSMPNGQSSTNNNEVAKSTTCIALSSTASSLSSHTIGVDRPTNIEEGKRVVMIGTALVNVSTSASNQVLCRAILDSGSHMNFVTSDMCNLLQAKRYPTRKHITGIGGRESMIKHKLYLTITSRVTNYSTELKFYVIPKITNELPSVPLNIDVTSIPVELKLADPYFFVPDRIDLLLGVEIYNHLFKGDFVEVCKELPPFYNTELGYVVCGKAVATSIKPITQGTSVMLCNLQTLEAQMKQFWEMENLPTLNHQSAEEQLCEQHYNRTVNRLPCGRYSVALPTNSNIDHLGCSYGSAQRQFFALVKRLIQRPKIYDQYRDFMAEYISLGHMVPATIDNKAKNYYLPHHFVMKESSSTTKLRVVFNASSKTSSQLSLNDCLMVGPTIQQTLFTIMIRFRKHLYAFCGDIAKMYRQIRVHDDQQDLQRIWWRNHPSENLQFFKLCTVTYGTASAPFLATRTLKQLTLDEYDKCPKAAKVIQQDFYVDDVLTGCSTLSDALSLKADLIKFLRLGGFELRKFCSNNVSLASEESLDTEISLILGLSWNTSNDTFESHLDKLSSTTHCTKRNMLSEICQLFDPLGFCAPIIVTAKLFMQTLWTLCDIGWDDMLPEKISEKWIKFKSELTNLKRITIPRCLVTLSAKKVELHGYGDASERAFGCVFYVRSTDQSNNHHVTLLCAKSRVAPLKKQSIPRLELCAALLVAEMTTKLISSLDMTFDAVYLWSDSEVTLFRIRSEPYKYTAFLANRIAKIQEHTKLFNWQYVNTSTNPADLVSRGLMPSEFLNAYLWWHGPTYLHQPKAEWPRNSNLQLNSELANLDVRQPAMIALSQMEERDQKIFERYHSLTKLLRVVAYMIRFWQNAKSKRSLYLTIQLSSQEIATSLTLLIKLVQTMEFKDEQRALRMNQALAKKSSLRALSPFIDINGVLRVGGRLANATISYDQKHQIILPGNHRLTKLIARQEHYRLLHAGPQALLYNLRLNYWIIGGRNFCRAIVHQCVRCFHARPHIRQQIMGELPHERVNQSMRPFIVVGIDFCGPFMAKQTTRSKIVIKLNICVFVCFSMKATHMELVMNLSAESFIACLRRFVSRRGMCSKIYSDNATNFTGARTELRQLKHLFLSQKFQEKTIEYCTENNIEWLTIPPRSPHFGGLWESAVKSAKHHMKRVIGQSSFTLEEGNTLTSQIEACLNSRPLTVMSNDPTDLNALSPGHFLIGSPLTAVIEPSLLELKINRLSRFQQIQQMIQQFWKRWHVEYLSELQRRYRWSSGNHQIQIGSLALVHDDNIPPMNWVLGRITEIHPGQDGVVRVVTIKTAKTVLKRAVHRIRILPTDDDA